MRRELALLAGAAGGALGVLLLRRRRVEPGAAPVPGGDARDDLRRKLAEARETAIEGDDFEVAGMAAETVIRDDEPPQATDVDALRRRVHEEARAAADEMKRRETEGG